MALFRKKRVPVFGLKIQAEAGPVIGRIDETKPRGAGMARFLAGGRREEKGRRAMRSLAEPHTPDTSPLVGEVAVAQRRREGGRNATGSDTPPPPPTPTMRAMRSSIFANLASARIQPRKVTSIAAP